MVATTLDVLQASAHRILTQMDVIDASGATIASGLDVSDGQVTVEKGRACRRECTVTIVDPDGSLVPSDIRDLLHPMSGNQFRLHRGLYDLAGQYPLLYPLGTFVLNRPRIVDTGDSLTIQITGQDRAKIVQEGRLTDTLTIPSGTNYSTAIQTLVETAYPLVAPSFMGTTRTTPQLVFDAQTDPWDAASQMANALGAELFFDAYGYCVLQAETLAGQTLIPIAEYVEGDTAMLLDLSKDLDTEQSYNWVVVTGEHADLAAPVRAEAYDNNPSSPTYVEVSGGLVVAGRKKPRFYSSPFITTTAQAQESADAILARSKGTVENIELSAIVHPGLNVNDPILVRRERVAVDALYLVDQVTIPLKWDQPMQVATRRVV